MPRGNGHKARQATSTATGIEQYIRPDDAPGNIQAREYVDWAEIDTTLLGNAVWAASRMGGAILFGSNRDKTCYSVSIYAGGKGTPYYFPCNADGVGELDKFLRGFVANGVRYHENS